MPACLQTHKKAELVFLCLHPHHLILCFLQKHKILLFWTQNYKCKLQLKVLCLLCVLGVDPVQPPPQPTCGAPVAVCRVVGQLTHFSGEGLRRQLCHRGQQDKDEKHSAWVKGLTVLRKFWGTPDPTQWFPYEDLRDSWPWSGSRESASLQLLRLSDSLKLAPSEPRRPESPWCKVSYTWAQGWHPTQPCTAEPPQVKQTFMPRVPLAAYSEGQAFPV